MMNILIIKGESEDGFKQERIFFVGYLFLTQYLILDTVRYFNS
jgi:hypothetical protein